MPTAPSGLNREFPNEGIWNTALLAIAMHHVGLNSERDAAINFLLGFRSIQLAQTSR